MSPVPVEVVMRMLLLGVVVVLVSGCSDDGAGTSAAPSTSGTATTTATATESRATGFDQELHDELVAMLERDQSGRTGGPDAEGDAARTERLKEILAEHGWPTYDLVGQDGEDAAWAIAQHSDQDPAFRREALELLRTAVAAGQASPGNLAYLEDRVAVAAGQPQTYGTQVGCGPQGPEPATPLADPAAVDGLRTAAGLEPLADYLAEMAEICAAD
ncbi:DUF6624 domain-containing protein [Blastococcus haudaquaticus]|uniref:Uncharacterized protein n=1 Tax=Blastococcus haudaquaticus TaxID=1938745 RepID=A0A286H399_9ACTN|nr:DUF6624 domain-containing protein [Blastococcus haudaquaticus]SOE02172.1 hypothetical protein SAMN06272739_3387 [Blastococcus haudaquaticus]